MDIPGLNTAQFDKNNTPSAVKVLHGNWLVLFFLLLSLISTLTALRQVCDQTL